MREVKFRVLTGCRICDAPLRKVVHLCDSAIANSLEPTQEAALNAPILPLTLMACEDCGLFQLSIAVDKNELFGNYTYATPNNATMREHYADAWLWIYSTLVNKCDDAVVEIGGNTGAFLDYFNKAECSQVINVEPAKIKQVGSHVLVPKFFNHDTANKIVEHDGQASLIITRHCFAHIDNLHEIMEGVTHLLAPEGLFYIENAYMMDTLLGVQFDQIYHEHMSYLTLGAVDRLMRMHGMRLVDASVAPLHGGSIMMMAARESSTHRSTPELRHLMRAERLGLEQAENYFKTKLAGAMYRTRHNIFPPNTGPVDAYGAAAKAVTRFACAELTHEHIRQCYDDSPLKIGKFLPGSGIPIVASEQLYRSEPMAKTVVLTAWNYKREFEQREREFVLAGGRFVQ